jgi:hypothetical protein
MNSAAYPHPILPAGTRPSRELATEAEEVKEKVCRLNQEVGWDWLLLSNPGECDLGIREASSRSTCQILEEEF